MTSDLSIYLGTHTGTNTQGRVSLVKTNTINVLSSQKHSQILCGVPYSLVRVLNESFVVPRYCSQGHIFEGPRH